MVISPICRCFVTKSQLLLWSHISITMVILSKPSGSIIFGGCVGNDNHVGMVDQNVILVYQVMARVVSEMVMGWGNSVAVYFYCAVKGVVCTVWQQNVMQQYHNPVNLIPTVIQPSTASLLVDFIDFVVDILTSIKNKSF